MNEEVLMGKFKLCPNNTRGCNHYWHDVEDLDDPIPMCCEETCNCGKTEADKQKRREVLSEGT